MSLPKHAKMNRGSRMASPISFIFNKMIYSFLAISFSV